MSLPYDFIKFWIIDAPKSLFKYFLSLNDSYLQLFSLTLLVKTFFKPWKNEYRDGLVGFSIAMGMFIKTLVIIADVLIFFALLVFELLFFFSFILLPLISLFFLTYNSWFSQSVAFPTSIVAIIIIFLMYRKKTPFKEIVSSNKTTKEIIRYLLSKKEIQFVLRKAGIKKNEVEVLDVPKDTNAVTMFDFFASYILAIEDKTKLLFKKELKKEDFQNIAYWGKATFPNSLDEKPISSNYVGQGVFESWTYGWTIETQKYMVDLTSETLNKKPMLVGRKEEYSQFIETLAQGKSVLLIGEPGSGKNSLLEAFIMESYSDNLKGNLSHQRVFRLYLDTLLAGAENQGELEKRLDNIIEEISHSGNVIIYISDFENILGSSSFHVDLSGVLLPYLKNKTIRIVASATTGAYKRYIEPMSVLFDAFEVIKMREVTKDIALKMLLDKASSIEKEMKVDISYKAIKACIDLSGRYLIDRVLPGSGVVLLQDTANEARLNNKKTVLEEDVLKRVEEKTNVRVRPPDSAEKSLLLSLEKRMHESLIDQEEAVTSIAEGIRRIRSGLNASSKPISFLFLGPTGVGKTQTAKTLAKLYFGNEKNMLRFDMSEYSSEDTISRFIGSSIGVENEGISGKIHENPSSLILLDEFEKAHSKIHNLFLQVLDDGRLTDVNGKTVSFSNSIIIATSNAGSEFIRSKIKEGNAVDKHFKDQLLGHLLSENIFRPELVNRFDDIVVFKPLSEEDVQKITKLALADLYKKLQEKDINVNFDDKLVAKIAKEGFDEEFGARPLNRFIQDKLEDNLAQKIIKGEIQRGSKVLITVDAGNNLQFTVNT